MNESLKKPEKYRTRYMKSHKMLCVLLDKQKDRDIIGWLATQENASESVRSVLHDFIYAKSLSEAYDIWNTRKGDHD